MLGVWQFYMKGSTPCEDYFWFLSGGFRDLLVQTEQNAINHGLEAQMNSQEHGIACFFPNWTRWHFVHKTYIRQKRGILMQKV